MSMDWGVDLAHEFRWDPAVPVSHGP
jgi:hypothetical protein